MKQRISSYLVLFTLLLASTTYSHASSTGTISFTGLVKDDGTCKVEMLKIMAEQRLNLRMRMPQMDY